MSIVESTLANIFLEEANLVSKFGAEKMDKEKSLSEDNEPVQTFMRLGRPTKVGVKANNKTSKASQPNKSNGLDVH